MFLAASRPKIKKMHFASCSADGGKGDPIGLGELGLGRFRLRKGLQVSGRRAIGKARPCPTPSPPGTWSPHTIANESGGPSVRAFIEAKNRACELRDRIKRSL